MFQDLRFGFRTLRRATGFSILAILCLTLGIGANTSVFSWIEGILLRPFPAVPDQGRLFVLAGTARGATRANAVSWPDLLDLRQNCKLIDAFIADRLVATTLNIGDRAERAPAAWSHRITSIRSGREFTNADNETAALAAVVNEAMVTQFWHGADPTGKRVQVQGKWVRVVGVARNSRYRTFLETPTPFFYVPLRQNFSGQVNLHIRTRQRPETLAAALVREIHALDANLAPSEVISLREQVYRSTSSLRIAVVLLSIFGGLAMVLAAVGLYGVMAYVVSQSTRELGLRMALGARPSDVLRLVAGQSVELTAGGLALGVAAALGLTRLIADLLYKVDPRDPAAFASALAIMAVASLAACGAPAWRAMRTDPLRALRD